MIKAYRVYGAAGHRQRESFSKSYAFTDCKDIKYAVLNSDVTGTNDFTIVLVEHETEMGCDSAFNGQLSDGIFENSKCGEVVETIIAEC